MARSRSHRTAAVVIGVLVAVAVSGCTRDGGGGPAVPAGAATPFLVVDPASPSPTDRAIAAAQDRLRTNGGDDSARLALAGAFLQKARETGDPSLYTRVEVLLERAADGRDEDAALLVAQGTLALARHQFTDALEVGRRAVRLAPGNVGALAVVVDALNELGRYDEALEATQAMADAKPNLASLARVSYARELRGDLDGAIAAMAQAAAAGGGAGENVAYVQVQLGNLLLTAGDDAGAEAAYAAADTAFPGYPLAKAGRARVLVARGDPAGAAELLGEVVKVLPTAEVAVAHGDALAAAGDQAGAAEAYGLVEAIARLYRANGVDVDLELALFAADHSPGRAAVAQARRAVGARPSTQAHDALAWALFTAGQADAAWKEAGRALALGTRDPLIRFHAAAIAAATGRTELAAGHLGAVLATNPRFSAAHAAAVADLARTLGLAAPPDAGSGPEK